MFCKNCGNEIDDLAKFCSKCGTATSEESNDATYVDLDTPVVTARPVFIPWVSIVSIIPIQLFMTVWAGAIFGALGKIGAKKLGLDLPPWSTFVLFGALAFLGIGLIAYYTGKKTKTKTEYKFYADRLEYTERFGTAESKMIKYKNITEANLRRSIIQRKYGLGTIILSTPATGSQQGLSKSGITISDIENPEEIYAKIQKLIG